MKDVITLEMLNKIANEQNWTIRETICYLDMNYIPFSESVTRLAETIGLIGNYTVPDSKRRDN
jgi:hypothetical protein